MQLLSHPPYTKQARYEAGHYAKKRPIRLLSQIDRGDNSLLKIEVDFAASTGIQGGRAPWPQAGDVIGIFPENRAAHIALLEAHLAEDQQRRYFLKGRYETDEGQFYSREEALTYVALNPLKPDTLYRLHTRLTEQKPPQDSLLAHQLTLEALLQIHEESPDGSATILRHCHLCDLLSAFPGVLTLADICETQGANYRRVYTLAGVSRDESGYPTAVQFLVALGVSYQVPPEGFAPGMTYAGTCSDYLRRLLCDLQPDAAHPKAEVFIQPREFGGPEKNRAFFPSRFAPKPSQEFVTKLAQPLLLVGAGSGISGIRAIIEERCYWQQLGYEVGASTLVFGLRNQATDYLYQDDFQRWEQDGLIERILLAESRPSEGRKTYVQHVFVNDLCQRELKELGEGRRALAVCGDKKMGLTLTDGCLPIVLSMTCPHLQAGANFDEAPCRETLHSFFLTGQEAVQSLKDQRLLIRSTSGSRYPKKGVSFEEVYEEYFS